MYELTFSERLVIVLQCAYHVAGMERTIPEIHSEVLKISRATLPESGGEMPIDHEGMRRVTRIVFLRSFEILAG